MFATRQHHKMLCELRQRRRTAPIDAFLDWLLFSRAILFCYVAPYSNT